MQYGDRTQPQTESTLGCFKARANTNKNIQIQIQIQTEIQIQIQIQTEIQTEIQIQIQMQTESILDASKPKHQLTFEFCFVSDKYFFPSWHQRCYISISH